MMSFIKECVEDTEVGVTLKSTQYELFKVSKKMTDAGLDEKGMKEIIQRAVYKGPVRDVKNANHFIPTKISESEFRFEPCLCPSTVICGGQITSYEKLSEELVSFPKLSCKHLDCEIDQMMPKENILNEENKLEDKNLRTFQKMKNRRRLKFINNTFFLSNIIFCCLNVIYFILWVIKF